MEEQVGVQSQISPALTIVLLLVISIALGIYVQEHLNRVWDKAAGRQAPVVPPMPPSPPAMPPA
jgi:predicted RND superfamily exporter protein